MMPFSIDPTLEDVLGPVELLSEREATEEPECNDDSILDSPPPTPPHEDIPRPTIEHSPTNPFSESESQFVAAPVVQYGFFNPAPASAYTRPQAPIVPPTHILLGIREVEADTRVKDAEAAEGNGSQGASISVGISEPARGENQSSTSRGKLNGVGGQSCKIMDNSSGSRIYSNRVAYQPARLITPDADYDIMIIDDPSSVPKAVQERWKSYSPTAHIVIDDDGSAPVKQEPKEAVDLSQAPVRPALNQPKATAAPQTSVRPGPSQPPRLAAPPQTPVHARPTQLVVPFKSRFTLPRAPLPGEFDELQSHLPGNPRRQRQFINDPNATPVLATSATSDIAARQRAMLAHKFNSHVNAVAGPSSSPFASPFGQRRHSDADDAGGSGSRKRRRSQIRNEGQVVHDDPEQVDAAMRDQEDHSWMDEEGGEDEEYEDLNKRIGKLYRRECSGKINAVEKMELFKLRKKLASKDRLRAAARGDQTDSDADAGEEEELFVRETREDVVRR
jgi:hypothetical protein